jgi:hypothetical protein
MRAPSDGTRGGALRVVWTGDSETDCVEICRDLQLSGIEYRVSQTSVGLSGRMGVRWKFAIGVTSLDYEAAKKALGLDVQTNGSADENYELRDTAATTDVARPDEAKVQAEDYLRRWRHEDATLRIWSQSSSDKSSIVGLSLTENLIRYRTERGKDGMRQYFVLPEDELRAREILRQIEKGEPAGGA